MSSSSQSTWRGANHRVYISLYGPDLGPTFLSHLRSSLYKCGVHTYNFRNINLASFSWSLNELREIMEHRKHGKLKVFPVFYSVDPTDVRTPRKSFERALVIHENTFGKDSAKVKSWRGVISEAGGLSGFCLKNHW